MCNHYRNDIRKAGLSSDIYGFEEFSETKIRFDNHPVDIYPDRPAMIGRLHAGKLEFVEMRWGFPPPPTGPKKLRTNTRRLHLPFWKPWLGPEHRCLVPFSSFAEWVEGPEGKPKEMWFAPADGCIGYFAGIWRLWTGTRGTKKEPVTGDHLVFSLLTSEPNTVLGHYHDRMPAILPDRAAQEAWLQAPANAVGDFQKPLADDRLDILSDRSDFIRLFQ
jgi:putative SOS response-associated peptidase YedK